MDVIELRKRFLVEFVTNRFHYHDEDAKRVRESDFWIKRFILHKNQGSNAAFYHMKDTFKWKKNFGIHDFNPIDIPREVHQLSPIFSYLPDKKGVIPIYIRCRMIIKIDLFEEKMKQYFAMIMDRVDNQVRKPRGWALVFDCQGAGIENANFELMFFAMSVIGKYFPMQPSYVLAFGIPWMMKPFIKMGLSMIPEEAMKLLKFIDCPEDLMDIIPAEHLPDFLGGTAKQDYRNVPTNSQSCIEVGKRLFKLSEAEVEQMIEPLRYLMHQYNLNNNDDGSSTTSSSSSIKGDDEEDGSKCQKKSSESSSKTSSSRNNGSSKPLSFIEEFD